MEEAKKPKTKIMAVIIIVLVLAVGSTTAALKIIASDTQTDKPTVAVQDGGETLSGAQVIFTAATNKTVLEQLQEHADVEIKNSDYGPFVESINGVSGGGKYWVFYVDGQMAQVGAGEYETKGGEKIEWKFE